MSEKDYSLTRLYNEAFACVQCGYCRRVCPIYQALGWESAAPRNKVFQIQNLLSTSPRTALEDTDPELSKRIWQCTNCNRCVEVCPTEIDLMGLWQGMKHHLAKQGKVPGPIQSTKKRVQQQGNIFALPNANRTFWGMTVPGYPEVLKPKNPDLAVFVGCVASFYPLVSGLPRTFAQIMLNSGIKAYFLGADEYCCGHPLATAGDTEVMPELVRRNIQKVLDLGVKELVFLCPSCETTWKNEYPAFYGGELPFTMLHATEYLADLVDRGRIKMNPYPHKVTYHDPCDLGRKMGIYEPPRRILRHIPELEFVELTNHHENALCCGAGGNLHMVDLDLANQIGQNRVAQVIASGADTLVTACAECRQVLTLALQDAKSTIRVLDIVELVGELTREETER